MGAIRSWAFFTASLLLTIFIVAAGCKQDEAPPPAAASAPAIEPAPLGEVANVHRFGNIYLAGATNESDIAAIKAAGIERVVNIRLQDEYPFDESVACELAGLDYVALPFNSLESLTDEVFDRGRALLREGRDKPMLLHCGSANRAGVIWLAHRVLDGGLTFDAALAEARQVGLRSNGLIERARQYVEARAAAQ